MVCRGAWGEPGRACGAKAGLGATRPDPSLVLYHTLSYAVCFGDSWEESAESGMAAFPKLMSYCSKLSWGRMNHRGCVAWRGVMRCAEGRTRQQQLAPRCPVVLRDCPTGALGCAGLSSPTLHISSPNKGFGLLRCLCGDT